MWRLIFFVYCVTLVNGELIRLSLEKNKNEVPTLESINAEKEFILYKQSQSNKILTDIPEAPLYQIQNFYYGYVYIGTPPQKIKVIFDTGSAYTWILTTQICDGNPKCGKTEPIPFNISLSSTYDGLGVDFDSSESLTHSISVSGLYAIDMFTIAGITIKNQVFGEIYSESNYATFPVAGIIGLALDPKETFLANTFFESMLKQQLIDEPIFAMSLSENGGEIIFGGSDSTLYNGELNYLPVETSNGIWEVNITSISMNGMELGSNILMALETNVNEITVPLHVYVKINEFIGAVYYEDVEYIVDCSKISQFPDLVVTVNNMDVSIKSNDYIQSITDSKGQTTCVSKIKYIDNQSSEGTYYYILGQLYLKHVYAEYDLKNNRVGLALSN